MGPCLVISQGNSGIQSRPLCL